jgi:D-glucosaminate-6-phosphate ammonia-lyase
MGDIISRLDLQRIVNASGTMTVLGASRVPAKVAAMAVEILDHFVDIDALQARASQSIARATGAEAGCVTSSAASGIAVAVAAAMTGPDLKRIEMLPETGGLKNEVVIQPGHLVNYGAPLEQAIRLAGAKVKPTANDIENSIGAQTAAALYVVSHHVTDRGIGLADFIARCRACGIGVIVDMASEYDLKGPIALGADVAIYSAHKFLGGLTAGIMAGRKDFIRSAYLQNRGIGRHMKVGKEGIAAAMAALDAWDKRNHQLIRERELSIVSGWLASLGKVGGLEVAREPDWTGNPIERVKVTVGKEAGLFAWELAERLAARDPSVRVRDDLVAEGYFFLDPCNLAPGEEKLVADAISAEVASAQKNGDGRQMSYAQYSDRLASRFSNWPDSYQ